MLKTVVRNEDLTSLRLLKDSQVTRCELVPLNDRLLAGDDVVNACVGRISCFLLGECENGTIGSSAAGLEAMSFSRLAGNEGNIHFL